jgi:hypothetical protein
VIKRTVLLVEAAYVALQRRPSGLPDTRPGHPREGLDWPATSALRAPIQATSIWMAHFGAPFFLLWMPN